MNRPLVLVLGLMVWSCGGLGGRNARCDMRPSTPQCTDWRNSLTPVWTTQEALCRTLGATSAGGTFTEGQTCPTAEQLGGCQSQFGDRSLQTNWYYKSDKYKTKDDARAECTGSMTFVEPG